MSFEEVVLIIIIVAFVVFIFGREIYKKVKKLPTGECSFCHSSSRNLLKNYRKKYKKNDCCNK